MAGQGSPAADKLRAFLQGLKPGSRALLIAELERGLLQGTGSAGAEFVLAELRRSLRDGQSKASRFGDPARLFFQPVEPFLVDDGPDHKHRGRIARSALEPLWLWIGNTLMPEEAKGYADRVEHALMAGDSDKAEHQARNFQDLTVVRITQMLDSADDRDYRRLNVQLGTSRALDDVQALRGILNSRDRLAMLGTHLPGHINSLAGPVLESVKAQIDSPLGGESDMFVYSLVLVMSKLASPWQLIRLAIKAAGSDDAKRIGETSYAVAVEIVLEEADRRVRELAADLKSGRGIAVAALLKEVHDTLRGLRSEINLSPESVWGKQLTALRAQVSKVLTGEVELMPGRVRRLIRPRPSKEIAPGSRLHRRSDGNRSADRFRRGLPQLCQRTCHQRGHATHLQRVAAAPRQRHAYAARRVARRAQWRTSLPAIADRCGGEVLRQSVRAGICLAAHQGGRGRLA
jgi:hypothetical protein